MIDVLLLLALPASGKSEIRRYLDHLQPETLRTEMGLGPTVQLDDYPYVHLMRRISAELDDLTGEPPFFDSLEASWSDPRDWLTLIHLVNDDSAALERGRAPETARQVLDRIDAARERADGPAVIRPLSAHTRSVLEDRLESDVAELPNIAARPSGTTVVIEFARGGPEGASMPLPHPLGYRASIAALAEPILDRARILYVWVDPEESRRRNRERAIPGPDGDASILHHAVPDLVMRRDYGVDDIGWLEAHGRRPGAIPIGDRDLPFARFDNRVDRTSFLREPSDQWPAGPVRELHVDLAKALKGLASG